MEDQGWVWGIQVGPPWIEAALPCPTKLRSWELEACSLESVQQVKGNHQYLVLIGIGNGES